MPKIFIEFFLNIRFRYQKIQFILYSGLYYGLFCMKLQISQTDSHSKILCQSCYKHLQNACQFVEIVKKADEVLNLRLGNNPDTPDSWPKPIQVDKNVPYDKIQIKDEILSDEETQQINGDDFSNVDVKIEADDWPSQSVHINGKLLI